MMSLLVRSNTNEESTNESPVPWLPVSWNRSSSILAIVIAVVGIAVIIAGAWGAVVLIAQKADTPVPLRYYAIVIGTIGTGVSLLGIAQGLRILLLILGKVAIVPP